MAPRAFLTLLLYGFGAGRGGAFPVKEIFKTVWSWILLLFVCFTVMIAVVLLWLFPGCGSHMLLLGFHLTLSCVLCSLGTLLDPLGINYTGSRWDLPPRREEDEVPKHIHDGTDVNI